MKDIEIFIAAHKKFNVPVDSIYVPLHVGSEGKEDLGYIKDNDGENISLKNPNYCELTGVYYIWKNIKAKIVGLVHYRRYFYKSVFSNKILDEKDIIRIFTKYDIIVPQRGYTWGNTVRGQYIKNHVSNDLIECEKILKEKYPDYSDDFDAVFNGNFYCPFNMIITKKEIFDEYSEWLFDIFSDLENRINLADRDNYNMRVYGFLSERLLNVWLKKHDDYKTIEMPVFNTEENMFRQRVQSLIKKLMFWK